jgi:hypothetical protein
MTRKPSPAVFLSEELQDFLKGLPLSHKFNKWIEGMRSVLKET